MNSYLFTLEFDIDGLQVSRFLNVTVLIGMTPEEYAGAVEMMKLMGDASALTSLAHNAHMMRRILPKLASTGPCYQVDCEIDLDIQDLEHLLLVKQQNGTLKAWLAEREVR